MLCFLETPFLRFFLLLYYLRRKEILRGRWFSRIIFPGPVILLAISQNKDSSTGFFCENCKIFGPAIFRTSVGDYFSQNQRDFDKMICSEATTRGVLQFKISEILQKNTCFDHLQACRFIKKRLQHSHFPWKFPKSSRTPFLKNICERQLLFIAKAKT